MSTAAATPVLLIVDDSEVCAETLSVALEMLGGLRAVAVPTAEAALPWIDRGVVRALVTDVQLSGMSGLDLVARIRQHRPQDGMAVMVVSGAPDPALESKALSAGANAFFRKPYSPSEVRKRLEQLLA